MIPWECPICLCDIFTAPGGEHQGRPICGTCWRESASASEYQDTRLRRLAARRHQNETHTRAGRGQFVTVRGHAKSQHQPHCSRCGRTDNLVVRDGRIVTLCKPCRSAYDKERWARVREERLRQMADTHRARKARR